MINIQNGKHNLSFVISGWPAVGKTTIAAELAKEFRLEIYNGGDILKMLAGEKGYSISGKDWWDTEDAKKFMTERKSNPCFDKEVDQRLVEIVKKGNVVITSYTLPWLVQDAIKFWLKGSQSNRAKRMAYRDNISFEDAKNIIKIRDEDNIKIYRETYGFNFGEDLSVFDFALNTDLISLEALIVISKSIVKQLII
ncbi:MAG TPA: cytidylate kinase family protein [Nitrososphaeraceae archaeon]|nr:cytidylate kinase family protein [Nitrososphaeraceae archaeon]